MPFVAIVATRCCLVQESFVRATLASAGQPVLERVDIALIVFDFRQPVAHVIRGADPAAADVQRYHQAVSDCDFALGRLLFAVTPGAINELDFKMVYSRRLLR